MLIWKKKIKYIIYNFLILLSFAFVRKNRTERQTRWKIDRLKISCTLSAFNKDIRFLHKALALCKFSILINIHCFKFYNNESVSLDNKQHSEQIPSSLNFWAVSFSSTWTALPLAQFCVCSLCCHFQSRKLTQIVWNWTNTLYQVYVCLIQ